MDFYSIGEMVIDFLPGSEAGSYIRNAGGAPANCAIAVSRNGLDAGFCGLMGDDDFGRFLHNTLADNNVKILCPRLTNEAVTTMAFVTLENGERSFTFARKPGADMLLSVDDVNECDLQNSKVIHAGSCSLSKGSQVDATLFALRRGKELGKLVSFDVNYRELLWDSNEQAAVEMIRKALPYVNLLKVSDEETVLLGGDIHAIMAEFDIPLVVETLGAKGARCFFKESVLSSDCPDVKHVVDTTGAGDAFWGTFLASLLIGGVLNVTHITKEKISRAIEEGVIAGSLCVQKKGAITSLPTREEILKVLGG